MIIGITGLVIDQQGNKGSAGAGKDTVANRLVETHHFWRLGIGDAVKRIAKELWGFSDETLWGSSERRNDCSPRVPNLTARFALQMLGTEVARKIDPDVWIRYAIQSADLTAHHVCFSDVRFKNELEFIRRGGGKVIRVVRPVKKLSIGSNHQSENDLIDIPDTKFDYVIVGKDGDVPGLQVATDEMMTIL